MSRTSEWIESEQWRFAVLAFLALMILLPSIHSGDLRGYDDALYAHEAKQMIRTGDWWNVRFNGDLNFEYPPMFMWMEALSMKIFGIADLAAKLPVAVLGFGTILLTYAFAFELSKDRWLSLLTMAVLMSTQYFLKYSTHAMTDIPCTFFFLLAIYAYLRGLRSPAWFLLAGTAIGFVILTRSVVGLIPLPVIGLHLILTRRLSDIRSLYVMPALLLAFVIPGIWYVSQYQLHGSAFTSGALSFVNDKVSDGHEGVWQRFMGLLVYPKLMLRSYWPWLPFLAVGLVQQFRRARSMDSPALLTLLWIGCLVLPFSIAHNKVLRYLMPAFPAFSFIAASALNDWIPVHQRQHVLKYMYGIGIAGILGIGLIPLFSSARPGDMRMLAPIAEANCPTNQHIVLYTSGRLEYDINNQLLWYGNRFTELPIVLDGVKADFEGGDHTVAIMDRNTFKTFPEMLGSGFQVEILGQSERFVCFKATRRL